MHTLSKPSEGCSVFVFGSGTGFLGCWVTYPNMAEAGFNRFGVGGRLTSSGGRLCLGGIAAACNNATILSRDDNNSLHV